MRLKSAPAHRSGRQQSPRAARVKSWNQARRHLVVQFQEAPDAGKLEILKSRGATIVQAVPDHGVMLSAPANLDLSNLDLRQARPLVPAEKVSRLMELRTASGAPVKFLLEFFPDTSVGEARAIAAREGLHILENPDLLPNQLLVEGVSKQIAGLAEWDEVAYIFPASLELVQGIPVVSCAGAVTNAGPVGQYVAAIGPGWDGYGLNSADLSYSFGGLTQQLPQDLVKSELQRAMAEWSKYAQVRFNPGGYATAPRNVNILFARGYHGDQYPFDGPGRVLAHTFYPAPPNPESIAGDLHLDDDEIWRAGSGTDVYSVSLHELGHALGLGHADDPNAVMYPYYRQATVLTNIDIAAIREVYAARDDGSSPSQIQLQIGQPGAALTTGAESIVASGTTSGGTAPMQVTWRSDRGWSGTATVLASGQWLAAVTLNLGVNVITVTARDARLFSATRTFSVTRQPKAAQLAVLVTSPTPQGFYQTQQSTVTLRGAASPATDISLVQWTSTSGYSGYANGTANWSVRPVTLRPGSNRITITARGYSGQTATTFIDVSYVASSPAAPSADTTPPSLAVTFPVSVSVLTSAATIAFQGTATDNVSVVRVTWSSNSGTSGQAAGTNFWNSGDIPLLIGDNAITIRAYDDAGNSSWRSVTVTRR